MKFSQVTSKLAATLLAVATTTWASPLAALPSSDSNNNKATAAHQLQRRANDYSCSSTSHPNPVVLIHGLFANEYDDLLEVQYYLEDNDFCVYTLTYGYYDEFPLVGGLKSIPDSSAAELGAFILQVKNLTGASKVDLVGHSEGGFQSLFVPKFISGVSDIVDNIVAIAPPTYGTTVDDLITIATLLGDATDTTADVREAFDALGCPACEQLAIGGSAVLELDNGTIRQSDNNILILATIHDEVVTPPYVAFVNETGVTNRYIQDRCPLDLSGHIGVTYSGNTFAEIHNWLDSTYELPTICSVALNPLKE